MLLIVLAIIAVVISIILVRATLSAKQMVVTRVRDMPVPASAVFDQVDDFHRWRAWSPWASIDPNMTLTIGGAPRGEGATYEWQGNKKVGAGRMRIERSHPDQSIDVRLEFLAPWKAVNPTTFTFAPHGDGTRVTWTMHSERNFMMRLMSQFINFDRMIGRDFEKGLAAMEAAAATR